MLGRALAQWWKSDPDAAKEHLESSDLNEKQASRAQSELARELTAEPGFAEKAIAEVESGSIAAQIIRTLASKDPEGALKIAESLPLGHKQNWSLLVACEIFAKFDSEAMLERLPKLSEQLSDQWPQHRPLEETLMKTLRGQGREATQIWLDQLPPPIEGASLIPTLTSGPHANQSA
ncbi:MAG: hypothetical protein ACI8T1_000778 [Verrucomicrobiales bacterium]